MRSTAPLFLLLFLLGALCNLMLSPPPTASSSSLVHRQTSGVRHARIDASRSPYQSPRQRHLQRSGGQRSPFRDIANFPPPQNTAAGPSAEQERSHAREAERERQAALQETPSRRRRRVPGQAENRAPSPTPGAQQAVGSGYAPGFPGTAAVSASSCAASSA
ncbi:hypothetical protein DFH06DRAFT_1125018 [Mycena polygramma]|nr:hypothetical protein DFH06DRAFT_1125018 [Mycena polygramma]